MGQRIFFAAFPPLELSERWVELRASLDIPGARWLRAEQMHWTLLFLGDSPPAQVELATAALSEVCAKCASGELHVAGIGAFPNLRRPRVAFLRVGDGGERLAALNRGLSGAMGRPLDDPYQPHLTLARFREPPGPAAVDALRAAFEGQAWTCGLTEACLVQSTLTPAGARYDVLARAALPPSLPR